MRRYIDIVETLAPSDELLDALDHWMHNYSQDDAHTGGNNHECDRIIALAKDYPVEYKGVLYRATAIHDDLAQALARGETVTLPALPKKLASWTKNVHTAELFADNAVYDNHSAVIVAFNSSELGLVVDMDLLYDNRPEVGHESEVLAYNRALRITPEKVVSLWVYDEDAEESVQVK